VNLNHPLTDKRKFKLRNSLKPFLAAPNTLLDSHMKASSTLGDLISKGSWDLETLKIEVNLM